MVADYAYSSDPAAPKPPEILGAAVERIEIVIPNLASQAGDIALLRARAADGCRVRVLIEDPHDLIEPLLDVDAIEIRASPAGVEHILYRADDQILLALRHISFPEQSPPLIHLRQANYGGLSTGLSTTSTTAGSRRPRSPATCSTRVYLQDTEVEPGS